MITVVNHCVKSVQIRSFFWSVFSRIRTEYGEKRSISPYSVRIQENSDQEKRRIWTLLTQWIKYIINLFSTNFRTTWSCSRSSFTRVSKVNELVMNKNKYINYSSLQKKGRKNKNGFIIKNNRLITFIVVTHQYCTD